MVAGAAGSAQGGWGNEMLRQGVNSSEALPSSFSSFPFSPSPSLALPLLSSSLPSFPPSLDLSFPSSMPKVTGHIYLPDTLLGTG